MEGYFVPEERERNYGESFKVGDGWWWWKGNRLFLSFILSFTNALLST